MVVWVGMVTMGLRRGGFESWPGGKGKCLLITTVEGEAGREMKLNPDFWPGPWGDNNALYRCGEPRNIDELRLELVAFQVCETISARVLPPAAMASKTQGSGEQH